MAGFSYDEKLYIAGAAIGCVLLIIIILLIDLNLKYKSLERALMKIEKNPNYLHCFTKPDIQPDEELSKRGYSKYTGDDGNEAPYYYSYGNSYRGSFNASDIVFENDRY